MSGIWIKANVVYLQPNMTFPPNLNKIEQTGTSPCIAQIPDFLHITQYDSYLLQLKTHDKAQESLLESQAYF